MGRQPLHTQAELRRARVVAYVLLSAGAIFMAVAALADSAISAPPAFMLALAGGLWLGRAEEAHARQRASG